MTDHTKETWEHISDTMEICGIPLTDDQRVVMAGAVATWIDHYKQQRDELLAALDQITVLRNIGSAHLCARAAIAKVKP